MHVELTRLIAVALKREGRWKIHWVYVTPVEFEGLTRYKARSEHSVKPYLVDLTEWWGIGKCGCIHFAARLEPTISRWPAEEREITDEHRCKHIRACRQYLGEDLVRKQLEVLKRKDTTRLTYVRKV